MFKICRNLCSFSIMKLNNVLIFVMAGCAMVAILNRFFFSQLTGCQYTFHVTFNNNIRGKQFHNFIIVRKNLNF